MVFNLSDIAIRLVASIIILLLGLIFGRFTSKLIQKILAELKINKLSKLELEVFISLFVKYFIYLVAILLALIQLNIIDVVIYGFVIIILLSLAIFIIFSLKEFIPNFFAGYLLRKKGKLKAGDKIKIKALEGVIQEMNWIETKVKTKNNDIIHVPNFNLFREA